MQLVNVVSVNHDIKHNRFTFFAVQITWLVSIDRVIVHPILYMTTFIYGMNPKVGLIKALYERRH